MSIKKTHYIIGPLASLMRFAKLNFFVFPVESAIQAAPVGPLSVISKESLHQSLHEFQKQAKQSTQEIMAQIEGESNLLRLKNKVIIIT